MKRIYVSISMLLVFQLYNGQSTPEPNNNYGLPKIVAPSQETFASSRISFEQSSNGDFTHQVPIYSQLRTPVSLNYSSGVRVDDIGTSTGMSWMLTAPGVISRVVKDETDENNTNWKPDTVNETADLAQIREAARTGNTMDTEYDWFNFSIANGLSGSFYIDNNLQVFIESKDKVKIEIKDLNSPVFGYGKLLRFKLTDKTGTEYYFGGAVENIERSTTQSAGPDSKAVTGWYLYKIISPDKRETNFTYITENLNYYSSLNAGFNLIAKCTTATAGPNYTYSDITKNKIIQQSYKPKLTLISEDDKNVSFIYGKARNDLFNSNAENNLLTSIEIKNGNLLVEKFNLDYQDVVASTAATYYGIPYDERSTRNRHFLKSLKNITKNISTDFSYYNPEKLPGRFSLDADYYGFANNRSNNSPFPTPGPHNNFGMFTPLSPFMPLSILSANKEVEPSWASIGNLKQITHPTKGISEIFYDPNSSAGATTKEVMELGGVEALYTPCDPSHNFPSGTFTFVSNGTPIHYFAAAGPYPAVGCYEPDPKLVKHTLTITDETTGTTVRTAAGNATKDLDSDAPGSSAIVTVAGHTYKATYTVKGQLASSGAARIYYNAHNVTTYEPVYFGGSRVSSIKESDVEGHSYTRKFYYNSLANISSPKTSVADFNINYIAANAGLTSKSCLSNTTENVEIVKIYTGGQNNQLPNFNHRRNKVTYTDITEVIDNKSAIERKFSHVPNIEYIVGKLPDIYNIPRSNSGEEKSYLLLEENRYQYESLAFKKQLMKSYKYEYGQLKSLKSYVFKENFLFFPVPFQDQLINISYGYYENYYGFYNPTEVKTTEYLPDGSAMTSTSFSSYNNPNHHQLTSSKTVFTDGSAQETNYSYAHEKGNQKLINANMVGIPLETKIVKRQNANDLSGKMLSRVETKYDDPANLLPTSVLSFDLQNAPSTEVTYDKYDSKGNLQQYTTKGGVSTVIIWGYYQSQPIAKIEDARLGSIDQSLIDNIVNASNLDASAERNNDETNLLNAFNTFKSSLGNHQITTYSYDPLIGVRSITPPSGIRENYLYDSANRLGKVVDANGKILKEMKYNYKN